MTDIKDGIERLNRAFGEFKKRNDQALKEQEKRGEETAETREQVEKINAEMTELRKEIAELEKRANRPGVGMERPEGETDPEAEVRKSAFIKYIRHGWDESRMTPEEKRALSSASDSEGGFLVPVDFESQIIMNAYDMAEIRPNAAARPTGRDTVFMGALSKPSVAWGRTNIAVSAQTLTAGGERITIYALRALTLLHNDTLDDAQADIVGEIVGAFGMAVAEAEDDAFAAGAGDDSPKGIVSDTRVQANYVPSQVAAALSDSTYNGIDALIGCFYKPKKTYRRNAVWMMNSTTEGVVRKLKDSDGQYLWQPMVQEGRPATLIGKPIANPEGMPDIAAGAFPIAFGDLRTGYAIRDRAGMSVQRLVEKYAEYDQTGILIKKRVGGQVIKAEAFACVKIAAS